MATNKAVILGYINAGDKPYIAINYRENDTFTEDRGVAVDLTGVTDNVGFVSAANTAMAAYEAGAGYSISTRIWPFQTTLSSALSFSPASRSLNSSFQVSSTRAAYVTYAVDIAATLSLTSGQTGTVTLQYADDSAFTTNVTTVQSAANGNTGTLTIGLNLTQTATATLTGMIPAGKYVKLVTTNTTGTPTFTYRNGQEVLLSFN